MRKNWKTKAILCISIMLITIAFASPISAFNITSDCNKINMTVTGESFNCNSIFEIGVCAYKDSVDKNVCQRVFSQLTNKNNSNNAIKEETSNKEIDTKSINAKNVDSNYLNNYWIKLINSFKNYLPVAQRPTKPVEPPVVTPPTTPTQPEKPAEPAKPAEPTKPTKPTVPTQPEKPTKPTKPTVPTQPEKPTKPTQPTVPTQPTTGLSAQEQQMINLVNSERAKAGLKPLTVDLNLVKVARVKSQDMINKGYFSHTSPTYGSPFEMMKSFGITYKTAGENLALNSSVQKAHTALMNSQGHRANILNSSFSHIGIGIASKGSSLYITQMFIGK